MAAGRGWVCQNGAPGSGPDRRKEAGRRQGGAGALAFCRLRPLARRKPAECQRSASVPVSSRVPRPRRSRIGSLLVAALAPKSRQHLFNMNPPSSSGKTRREFLKTSALVGGSAFAAPAVLTGCASRKPSEKAAVAAAAVAAAPAAVAQSAQTLKVGPDWLRRARLRRGQPGAERRPECGPHGDGRRLRGPTAEEPAEPAKERSPTRSRSPRTSASWAWTPTRR